MTHLIISLTLLINESVFLLAVAVQLWPVCRGSEFVSALAHFCIEIQDLDHLHKLKLVGVEEGVDNFGLLEQGIQSRVYFPAVVIRPFPQVLS